MPEAGAPDPSATTLPGDVPVGDRVRDVVARIKAEEVDRRLQAIADENARPDPNAPGGEVDRMLASAGVERAHPSGAGPVGETGSGNSAEPLPGDPPEDVATAATLVSDEAMSGAGSEPERSFHVERGVYFERYEDGGVGMICDAPDGERVHLLKVTASGWASIVGSVAAGGDSDQYFAALALHTGFEGGDSEQVAALRAFCDAANRPPSAPKKTQPPASAKQAPIEVPEPTRSIDVAE